MSIFKDIIHGTSSVFTCIVYVITIYYLCISFFGILRKKNERAVEPKKVFALIVAAHNEEIVIGDIVESLKKLDYPKELYDYFCYC
ncbi:glycosyltransferase [Clostridium carboxidivorans P7]|uniref:Glycosyltransferase n=1 Tax=Clostridium carboxidivorans P7 TaxID=536227 RepID=C6PV00_9CLOT|nr:glycosyltransferase [Clostridium carboxidivorans P7]